MKNLLTLVTLILTLACSRIPELEGTAYAQSSDAGAVGDSGTCSPPSAPLCDALQASCPGLRGPQGEQGVPGATGEQGPIGPIGAQGDVGPAGGQGPQGNVGASGPQGPQGPIGATGPAGADLTTTHWNYGTELDGTAQDGVHQSPLFRWGTSPLGTNYLRIGEGTQGLTRGVVQSLEYSAADRHNFMVNNVTYGSIWAHGGLPLWLISVPRFQIHNVLTQNFVELYEGIAVASPTAKAFVLLGQNATATSGNAQGGPLWVIGGGASSLSGTSKAGDVVVCGGLVSGACTGNVGLGMAPTSHGLETGTYQQVTDHGMRGGTYVACAAAAPTTAPTGGAYFYGDPGNSCKLTVWNPGDIAPHSL